MNNTKNISRGFLNSTFPFFIKIDRNGIVRDAGKSILRLLPQMIGGSIEDYITVKRPQNLNANFSEIKHHLQKIIFCELKLPTGTCFYKGQLIELEEEKRLCFLCTLFLNDPDDLTKHGIALNDFSISDSSADLLQVLQVNKMVTNDLEKMNGILQEKEKKYSEIIEHANEIIFTTDIEGNFNYMNEIGINFLQLEENITQLKFSDLIEKRHVQKIMNIGRKLLKKEIEVGYVEFQLKSSKKWIGQNITLLSNEAGYGFQGIGRDITEKRKYEKIILKESKKATEAAESKSRFLANMSHEIRTPLNGIMGLTELLVKGDLNKQQKKYLDAIKASSETLMVVINDILDISKIESGKMEIKKKAFNLQLCISQMIELMEAKAAEKDLQLISCIDEKIPEIIIGDESRLNQTLFNLVGNAIKFTQTGTVSIDASLVKIKGEKAEIKINIKDSGIGIPKEKMDGIFEAFQQVDGGENRTQKGTGLGLTITKKLVELMHGTITAESVINEGSCFSLNIPFKIGESTGTDKNKMESPLGTHDFTKVKILLAEDNPINQMVTIDILKVYNIEVELAENGQQAVDMMRKNKYDVILMDMQMPIMDGYQAMSEIRKEYSKSQVRMMALTAHVNEGEIKKCKSFGADDYLSKPYKPEDLYSKLVKLSKAPLDDSLNGNQKDSPISKEGNNKNSFLNLKRLNTFTCGVEHIKNMTINSLITELPKDLLKLREELNNRNISRVQSIAHRAKPNFKMVLKDEFAEPIVLIEQLSKKGNNWELIEAELIKIENNLQPIISELNNELKLVKS